MMGIVIFCVGLLKKHPCTREVAWSNTLQSAEQVMNATGDALEARLLMYSEGAVVGRIDARSVEVDRPRKGEAEVLTSPLTRCSVL